jgi:hypothetical protein
MATLYIQAGEGKWVRKSLIKVGVLKRLLVCATFCGRTRFAIDCPDASPLYLLDRSSKTIPREDWRVFAASDCT